MRGAERTIVEVAGIQLGAMVLFLGAGWLWPRRDDGFFHADTAINLATGAVLVLLKLLVIRHLIAGIGDGWLDLSVLPGPVQVVVAFLIIDSARWALHLAHHRVPFLWVFHRVHHSTERIDATAGLRMHVVDFVQLVFLPVLLFSVLIDVSGCPSWLVPAVMVPGVTLDAFQHSNLRLNIHSPFWRAWDWVLNNPHFHAWHHTDEGHTIDGNYGNALTIWDRMFRTCVSRDQLPERFGLDETSKLKNGPLGLQLLRPRRD